MKNGKSIAMAITAIVSAVTLTATAFAASVNVSGYEALKQAGFAALDSIDNYTMAMETVLYSDGEPALSSYYYEEINEGQGEFYRRYEDGGLYQSESWNENYSGGGYHTSLNSGEPNKYEQYNYRQNGAPSNGSTITLNQKKLMSIVADLFVGDVKNYFVSDGNRISISLSKNQIPELAQSILDVAAETFDRNNPSYPYEETGTDAVIAKYMYNPSIESGTMTATLTENGLPADVDMTADFTGMDKNGQTHIATLEVKLVFSNFGSTSPKVFDPTGKTKIEDVMAEEVPLATP